MAKKIKKFSRNINSPRRGGEKFNRAMRQFTIAVILYIVLVLIAMVIGGNAGEYDLSKPSFGGFAVIFLLFPAYLPLMIAGGIAGILGGGVYADCGGETLLLGGCDIFIAVNVWWIIRLAALKKQSTSFLRSARIFVLIMVYWGIFQIGCSLFFLAWQKSSFNAFHLHCASQGSVQDRQ